MFKSLQLLGFEIGHFNLLRTEKLKFGMGSIDPKKGMTAAYDLQFNRLRNCQVQASAHESYGPIMNYDAQSDSEFLRQHDKNYRDRYRTSFPEERLFHFSIVTRSSRFDLIAADFSLCVSDKGLIG